MDAKESVQNQVLEDIKAIALELSQIRSFTGLLAHQQKIQNLYEKYIFLKQLNMSKYQHILDDSSIEEVVKGISENKTIPHTAETTTQKINSQEEKKPSSLQEKEHTNITANFTGISEIEKNKDKKTKTEKPKEEKEIAEGLTPLTVEIAEIKPVKKEKKLPPIGLDFNDSIAFISQLFNGSKASMDEEFNHLNKTHSMEEAKKWIEEMFVKYNWKDKEEYVERLSGLIIRRFET